jgi:hypothetical protein
MSQLIHNWASEYSTANSAGWCDACLVEPLGGAVVGDSSCIKADGAGPRR